MYWLIGAGQMAIDYSHVLSDLKIEYKVVCRSLNSAKNFKQATGIVPFVGGLNFFLRSQSSIPEGVIVAVVVTELSSVVKELIDFGCKNILCEKPGALNLPEIEQLCDIAAKSGSKVYIGYNRRFYASVLECKRLIANDGGLLSMYFDFTEIEKKVAFKNSNTGEHWFLANSTHVVDLAFFIGGKPKKISTQFAGSLPWHTRSAVYSGSGVTENDVLFSYSANWLSAGRWGIEFHTQNYKLILQPLEELRVQKKGSFDVEIVPLNDALDKKFKPGLYQQVSNFIEGNIDNFLTLQDQKNLFGFYNLMSNY